MQGVTLMARLIGDTSERVVTTAQELTFCLACRYLT